MRYSDLRRLSECGSCQRRTQQLQHSADYYLAVHSTLPADWTSCQSLLDTACVRPLNTRHNVDINSTTTCTLHQLMRQQVLPQTRRQLPRQFVEDSSAICRPRDCTEHYSSPAEGTVNSAASLHHTSCFITLHFTHNLQSAAKNRHHLQRDLSKRLDILTN